MDQAGELVGTVGLRRRNRRARSRLERTANRSPRRLPRVPRNPRGYWTWTSKVPNVRIRSQQKCRLPGPTVIVTCKPVDYFWIEVREVMGKVAARICSESISLADRVAHGRWKQPERGTRYRRSTGCGRHDCLCHGRTTRAQRSGKKWIAPRRSKRTATSWIRLREAA